MNQNWKPLAFLGALIIAAAAAGTVLYMQGHENAEAFDAGDAPAAALLGAIPEAEGVHEGPRASIALDHAAPIPMTVYAAPTCGCCGTWVEHIAEHGFEIEVVHRPDMGTVKQELGLPSPLHSCHTAVVNDYVVEGHVPGEDLRRFLAEAPESRGLAVPGMPLGSPGMEVPTGEVDAYEVLSFTADGETTVFAKHGPVPPGG